MQSLFQAVRSASSSKTWSRGVELARAGAVVCDRDGEDEVVLRVTTRGGLVAPEVRLHPNDDEWECDCPAPEDPCPHVAAAVIALKRARAEGQKLPAPEAGGGGRVGYRLKRAGRALEFGRVVVSGEREEELRGSLVAIAAGAIDGPAFVASAADLRIEELLGARLRGALSPELMSRLLPALVECDDVRLDGEPVRVSTEPLLPIAELVDRGGGFELRLRPEPGLDELFSNGLGRCGQTLRPLGEARLTLRERDELPRGRYFGPDDVPHLVGEVLPALEQRIPVDVQTERLPRGEAVKPRLLVETRREGDALSVVPTLVYGDPPRARVEEGRLIHLQGSIPLRDRRAEEHLLRALRQELGLEPGRALALPPAEAIAFAQRLRDFSGDVAGSDHEQFFLAPELEPRFATRDGGFELAFESGAGAGAHRAGAAEALRAWRQGESLVPLAGGGFAPLPADWLGRHGPLVADLLAARDEEGGLPPCALPDLARLCDALGEPVPPGFERLRALLEDFDGLPAAELPADLCAELRSYQMRGVAWLAFLRDAGLGALLADDMGLGKTLQALCALRGRTLVVAPTSVIYGWSEQIARFRPRLALSIYHGPKRALDPQADVVLTTYAILRLDAERLAAEAWDTVVLDEAQAIKNPDSQVARAAFALRSDSRITLTGTPIENRLEELWSQLHFLNPGLLGSRRDFQARYARPIADGEPGAAAHLRQRIRPFVLRRLKSEVARELPPRTEGVLHCELGDEERAVYRAVQAATRRDVVERLRGGGSVLEALEALLRLRQAACHPGLVPGQSGESSAKLEVLLEALDEVTAEGHKSLVFSQWTRFLDLVEPHLRRADIAFARLDGSTRDRAAVVEAFQQEQGPPCLLISLRAGGTGLNLTAADHVFLLDPWWNPAVEDQAADRAHRIGQERPVSIYRLVARDTVEERILGLQESKRGLAAAALGGAERAASITREELLALLE
jgi:hypothetical protein